MKLYCQNCGHLEPQTDIAVNKHGWSDVDCPACGEDKLQVKKTHPEWVCADCGNEQDDANLCRSCGCIRVVLQTVAAELFGPDWRKAFE